MGVLLCEFITKLLKNAPLTFIRVRSLNFTDHKAEVVLKALNRNTLTTLTDVRLAYSPALFKTSEHLSIICQFLKRQTNLRYIDFRGCDLSAAAQ